jgi:hypothetical protein
VIVLTWLHGVRVKSLRTDSRSRLRDSVGRLTRGSKWISNRPTGTQHHATSSHIHQQEEPTRELTRLARRETRDPLIIPRQDKTRQDNSKQLQDYKQLQDERDKLETQGVLHGRGIRGRPHHGRHCQAVSRGKPASSVNPSAVRSHRIESLHLYISVCIYTQASMDERLQLMLHKRYSTKQCCCH